MSANYFYVLKQDENPENPREDQDWLGTMACWHRRYNLGDEQPSCEAKEHILNLVGWDEEKEEAVLNFWYNKYQAARWRIEAEEYELERTRLIKAISENTDLREEEVKHRMSVFSTAQLVDMLGAIDKNINNRKSYTWWGEVHTTGNTDDEMRDLLKEVHAVLFDGGPDLDKEAAIDLLFESEVWNRFTAVFREPERQNSDLWVATRRKVKERIAEEFDRLFISLPLFLYDHSGITMSTGRFSCPWDSGQVGFIYVSREKVREEYGWKVITKKREEKIVEILRDEVKTYDQYLTGDVYGYIVYEALPGLREALDISDDDQEDCDWQTIIGDIDLTNEEFLKEVDSCWGFYGEESAKEEAESSVRYREEHHAEVLMGRKQEEARRAGQLEWAL
jgi:hypothetical protein